jgi:predicted O-linked N-acetylglucosamine transferase (SPINDLY family)
MNPLVAANHLLASGRLTEALAAFAALERQAPGHPFVELGMAASLLRLGRRDEALPRLARVAGLGVRDLFVLHTLGKLEVEAGLLDAGFSHLRQGWAIKPDDLAVAEDLAILLGQSDLYAQALDVVAEARRRGLGGPRLDLAEASALVKLGMASEALELLRARAAASPADALVRESIARSTLYDAGSDGHAVRQAHEAFAATQRQMPLPRPPRRDAPITRIGFLSPDFNRHSVAAFALPLVDGLRTRGLEVFGYLTSTRRDDMTEAFVRSLTLRDVPSHTPAALAQTIRADALDVLVDLAGLGQGHRLATLAQRPAPMIATYLGYPATTGLPEVDLRLVDGLTDPAGFEAHGTERLARLDPCFLCYRPPHDAPDVGDPEPTGRGFVFGSFNALVKITPQTLSLWASILRRVPESRLLIKNSGMGDPRTRERLSERLAHAGVDPSRVEMVAWMPRTAHHLSVYRRVDVALDTFPYHGTTTTCEAMLMGVPTVTLLGDRHAARVGATILHAVGMPEFVTRSPEAYIEQAAEASRLGVRGRVDRQRVRARLEASPLRDEAGFAERFIAALEQARR